ncbi:MAG: Uma2 family endonuclease [Nostoc sp. DedVER02]|uniref:Uma2 family endonuclease n=1 Tax=unclassified Nostoc TaxID=2593658 RepID=UPI002AD47566|nr:MULTISPECIES: Uma2 family endonuclease [unclassified Nostoc]MDZ7988183.1 Uma2 family endonuclease [Nostoc sp. DedVER02]MDZ8113479.1 Uma2 family endonuclease [Nostoc sp. DedVER01b]
MTSEKITVQAKIKEYISNDVQLEWLIDSINQQAFVYRLDGSITQYPATAILSGKNVVPGFTFFLTRLL